MSKYCNCFGFSQNETTMDTSRREQLIDIYDSIHKPKSTDIKEETKYDFTQMEYNKTLSEVNKIKQKLSGNTPKKS